jgi:hypothetical protein
MLQGVQLIFNKTRIRQYLVLILNYFWKEKIEDLILDYNGKRRITRSIHNWGTKKECLI